MNVLGIDIGGTSTKIGVVDPDGHMVGFRSMPTDATGEDPVPFLARLMDLIEPVRSLYAFGGVGASMHGMLDDAGDGAVICNNTPSLRGFNMRAWLASRYGLPVIINNDLTAHALAEYQFGAGKGAKRFLCLALGTGIGAGVVVDGKPLRFLGGRAGDTGRIILDPEGPPDIYGAHGSAEGLCGVAGIERLAAQRYGHPVEARAVITAARAGTDPLAEQIMEQVGAYIGQLLASLCMVFLPDKVALTGGTAEAGSVLLEAARARFEAIAGEYHRILVRTMPQVYSGVSIVLGESRGETGVLGAAVELLERLNTPAPRAATSH